MSILNQVEETLKNREQQYGKTLNCHQSIAKMWSLYLNIKGHELELTPSDVAMMMVLFKSVRETIQHKPDNIIDMIAYASFIHDFEAIL